jgi:hypothetical protein
MLATPEAGSPLMRRVGAAHRAFHALADAEADDPRVAVLVPELAAAVGEAAADVLPDAEALAAGGAPGAAPAPDAETVRSAMSAALSLLSPAQRRVMEGVLGILVGDLLEEDR